MDRSAACISDHSAAVRTPRSAALDLVLPAATGERREPAPAPAAGRVVYGLPVFRQPPNGSHAQGEPQARPATDGHSRHRSAVSQTEPEPPGIRAPDLSIP